MRIIPGISALTQGGVEQLKSMRASFPGTAGSPNRQILRATIIIGLLTLLAKMAAVVKELVVAGTFGRSDALDAFFIAFLLPSFVLSLVINGFASALIPVFVATREQKGREAAQKLFSSVMFLVLIALAAMAILLGVLAPYYLPYLGSGFSPGKLRLTRDLLYVLLPFVLLNGVSACASAILNAGEKFALPALAPIATALTTILFMAFAARTWGAFSLAGGVVAGSAIEAALLLRALKKQGMQLSVKWNGVDSGVGSFLGQFFPALGAGFLMGSTSLVDQSMAAMLPGGSVAALNYGNRITNTVLTIGAYALSTAAFPYLCKMAAQNDWNGVRHTLKRYTNLVLVISVPLTLGLMACSTPLVRFLFQRGAFTAADTSLVSRVQVCYAVQIPFCILGMLFVKFVSSVRRNNMILGCSAVSLTLNIVLNLALMRIWGVAGIALSTSLVWVVGAVAVASLSILHLRRVHFAGAAAATQNATP